MGKWEFHDVAHPFRVILFTTLILDLWYKLVKLPILFDRTVNLKIRSILSARKK